MRWPPDPDQDDSGCDGDTDWDLYTSFDDLFGGEEAAEQSALQLIAGEIEAEHEARTTTDPGRQLRLARNYPHYVIDLLKNPNITDDALDAIETDDPDARALLVQHPRCPQRWLETLSLSSNPQLRERAAAHPNNSDIGRAWAQEDHDDSDGPLMERRHEPIEAYEGALSLLDPDRAAAQKYANAAVEAESFEDEYLVEITAARHPRAPVFILERIAAKLLPRAKKSRRRSTVQTFGREPSSELSHRNNDTAFALYALQLVARHTNTPRQVLRVLRDTNDPTILGALAHNPHCHLPTLKRILAIDDAALRRDLASHPSRKIGDIARHLRNVAQDDVEVLTVLASNPYLPTHHLEALMALDHERISEALAANPALDDRHVLALAHHKSLRVRTAVATHASIDAGIVEALRRRRNTPTLLEGLAANPRTPPAYLDAIHKHPTTTRHVHKLLAANPNLRPAALRAYADDHTMARALARNPALPEAWQRHLVASPSTGFLALVELAGNPACTVNTLYRLTGNGSLMRDITLHANVDAQSLDECEMFAVTDVELWVHLRIARLSLDPIFK